MLESSRLPPAIARALSSASAVAMPQRQAAQRAMGVAAIDEALAGGLALGRMHEIFARDAAGDASAMGFATMMARRLEGEAVPQKPMLWLREEKAQQHAGLNGEGLVDLGLDPARLVLGMLPDMKSLLRAGVDALRCAALGVVMLEIGGNPPLLDLTASRRLALAAESMGVTLLLLRLRGGRPMPSAAQTRWEVAPAPSALLEADAPGLPALSVRLLRQRGGPAGLDWTLEWDRDAGTFHPAALPGDRLPLSGGGPVPARIGDDERWAIAV